MDKIAVIQELSLLKDSYKDKIKTCIKLKKNHKVDSFDFVRLETKIKSYRRFNWEITEMLKELKKTK